MKTTIVESKGALQDEELRKTVTRICERTQALFPSSQLIIGEDFNDPEDPELNDNSGRIWIEEIEKKRFFPKHLQYLLTAFKGASPGNSICSVQHPRLLNIVQEEMEKFCTAVGGKEFEINKHFT